MAALPPSPSLCFLVTRVSERNVIDPEHVMVALTRLRVGCKGDKKGFNRGSLNPGELYAILHVVFLETEVMLHLHKKYYLSIA